MQVCLDSVHPIVLLMETTWDLSQSQMMTPQKVSPQKRSPPHDEVPEEPDQFAISVFKKQNNKATLLDSQQI